MGCFGFSTCSSIIKRLFMSNQVFSNFLCTIKKNYYQSHQNLEMLTVFFFTFHKFLNNKNIFLSLG
jgi:hypothetical protein